MSYWRSLWKSHDKQFIIEKKYHSQRVLPTETKVREKRGPRQNITTEQQAEINRRHREEKYARLIMDNFETGDWYLTLTFAERPDSSWAQKEIKNFMDRLHRRYNKLAVPFRWLRVIENITGRGRIHAHMLIGQDFLQSFGALQKLMQKLWPHGHVKIEPFGGQVMDAARMAAYFTKSQILDREGRISHSRNLRMTAPKKKIIKRAETYRDEIKAPKGYHVVEPLSYSFYTADGYPCLRAVYEKDDTPIKGGELGRRHIDSSKQKPLPQAMAQGGQHDTGKHTRRTK